MLFELKKIINKIFVYHTTQVKCVVATVVELNGSSYRKPGVRMLISENYEITGAVSGGCIEKEIIKRSSEVFKCEKSILISYDGRYRLGCEGILYILIEPINLGVSFFEDWFQYLTKRNPILLETFYNKENTVGSEYGTQIKLGSNLYQFNCQLIKYDSHSKFEQKLMPSTKLLIIGSEHDAVDMCKLAFNLGMDVEIIPNSFDQCTLDNFPGANSIHYIRPESFDNVQVDSETAIILMTHNYSQDFMYAKEILAKEYFYFGIIGSKSRKNNLLNDLIAHYPETEIDKLEAIHSPAGLPIGGITPQEIALAVLAEIINKHRSRQMSLK